MAQKKKSMKNQSQQKNQKMSQATNSSTSSYKQKLENMKYEIANEMGVDLKQGPNLTAREAGYVGGYMVKKMIEDVEQSKSNQSENNNSSNN